MPREPFAPLDRQIHHVRRRLLLRVFLNRLTWCLSAALALSILFMLLQAWLLPGLFGQATLLPRLELAAGMAAAAMLLASVLAFLATPSKLTAALLLDETFGLRERVTTSLSLTPAQRSTPMGQAMLADADQRVAGLNVRERIGIPLVWAMLLMPVSLALAVVTAIYCPVRANPNDGGPNGQAVAVAEPAEVKQKREELHKTIEEQKEKFKRPPTREKNDLEEIIDDLESAMSEPGDTEEKRREKLAEVTDLVDRLEKHEKELADKQKAQQEQLDRLSKKPKQDGPAKDLQEALAKGDLDKARQEAERLSQELEGGQLSKEDQQALKDQIEDLEKDLERLSRLEDEKQELKDMAEAGAIDEETLDREMEQLQKMEKDLKDLEDLAEELKDCEGGLQGENGEKAAQAMKRVARKIKSMSEGKQQRDGLSKLSRQARQAKNAMAGGMGRGKRPEAKTSDMTAKDTNVTTPNDPKGKKIVTGHGPLGGKNFKPNTPEEMSKELKQAAQEAPEAIARQRIPKAASDIAKGYYETLGGQKDDAPKGKPNP